MDVEQRDIDEALKGLTNPYVFTAHPKAAAVIRRLWQEVQVLRRHKEMEQAAPGYTERRKALRKEG